MTRYKTMLVYASLLIIGSRAVAQETLQTVTDRGNTTTKKIAISTTTQPESRLTVYGWNNGYFDVYNNANNSVSLAMKRSDGADILRIDGHTMTAHFGGNVGIGVSAPSYKLEVLGEAKLQTSIVTSSNTPFSASSVFYSQAGYNNIFGVDGTWASKYFGMKTDGTFLAMGGNVGIGTTTPSEKLSVNGNIRAKEIKVENNNWPDYVFAADYKLPSLSETARHIREKGHLPGIPSAKEVKANGLELGEMNKKLLEKIEELTLHLIDMKKESEQQRIEIEKLKSKIK